MVRCEGGTKTETDVLVGKGMLSQNRPFLLRNKLESPRNVPISLHSQRSPFSRSRRYRYLSIGRGVDEKGGVDKKF